MTGGVPFSGGIVSALVTPFTAQGKLDQPALKAIIEHQIDAGIDALFVLGTSGEGLLCGDFERREILDAVLTSAGGRLPVVVHVGAADTPTAAGLARHAASGSASAIAVLPPLFYRYSDDELLDHFATVADAAGGTDTYLYNNPGRVGFGLSPALIVRAFTEIGAVKGVKDTGDSLERVMTIRSLSADLAVFSGNNALILPALGIGAAGAVSTLANIVPELSAALLNAHRVGDAARALELQYAIVRLQAAMAAYPLIAATKTLLAWRGLGTAYVHRPMHPLADDASAALLRSVQREPELEAWLSRI
jgi:4-hydroxy-tetrahydrodipicolinate synthase